MGKQDEWDQAKYWQNEDPEAKPEAEPAPLPPVPVPTVAGRLGSKAIALLVLAVVIGGVAWMAMGSPDKPTTPVMAALPNQPVQSQVTPAGSETPSGTPSMIFTSEPPVTPVPTTAPVVAGAQTTKAQPPPVPPAPPPTKPATPEAGKVFRFASDVSGKVISVSGGDTQNGAQIVQNSVSGLSAQRWRLIDAGDGYFNIINVNSGHALDNPNGSAQSGTLMQQWAIIGTGNTNQQWRFVLVGSGRFMIVNRTSGKALDLPGGSSASGAAIQQWTAQPSNPNQKWVLALA